MLKSLLRVLTGILTFTIGFAAASAVVLFPAIPVVEVFDPNKVKANVRFDRYVETGFIEVEYAWSLMGKDALDGTFKVTNRTLHPVYYPGYAPATTQ